MSVYSCGSSQYGQLGIANEEGDKVDPTVITSLKGKKIVHVCCGEAHSAAITEYGDIYTWGRGREGQLGLGERLNMTVPTAVDSLGHERIIKAECGTYHTVALTDTGKVFTWGKIHRLLDEEPDNNVSTQYYGVGVKMPGLGLKNMLDKSHLQYLSGGSSQDELDQMQMGKDFGRFANVIQDVPLQVENLRGKRVVNVAAGYSFTAVITDAGQLFTWGFNEKGQLGLGHRFNVDAPRLVHPLQGVHIVGVACGAHHTITLDEHGKVYSCGLGVFGQLGHNNLKDLLTPKLIGSFPPGVTIVQVACGNYHTVARSSKGEMYSFGHGEYGQHGGSANYYDLSAGAKAGKDAHLYHSIPRIVEELKDIPLLHVSCGQLHSMAITENRQIYTWGWGVSGCLGHGDKRIQLAPRLVSMLQGEDISHTAAGWKHTLVVKSGSTSSFAFDFAPMLSDSRYTDITLFAGGKAIAAHKVIICSRCPYLHRIFLFHSRFVSNGQMPTEFTIPGVKYPIFLGFILYLYTDHLVIPPHLTKELASVARKWGLPRLEALCIRAAHRSWRSQDIVSIPSTTFAEQLKNAVNLKNFSDISFMVNGKPVYAHRVVLAARCPYFKRMFEGNFKERNQDTFEIEDGTSKESFLALLEFLYTGDESIMCSENVVELLALSDRFMVEDLKQLCEYFLERTVSSYISLIGLSEDESDEDVLDACDSIAALLGVADRYLAHRLKRVCLETMCSFGEKNWRLISKTKGFADLRVSSPHLIREIDYTATKSGLVTANSVVRGGV